MARPGLIHTFNGWWEATTGAMQLFATGVVTVAVSLVAVVLRLPFSLGMGLMIAGALLLSTAFLVELYFASIRLLDAPLGKLAAALIGTVVASASMAMSSVIFNAATGLSPGDFSYVVAFIAPLTAGYLLTAGTMLITACIFLWFIIYTPFALLLNILGGKAYARRLDADRVVIRMVGVVALVLTNIVALEVGGRSYQGALESVARGFTFVLEMYPEDTCVRPGERVRRVSSEVIAVARWEADAITFGYRACPVVEAVPPQG